MIGLVGKPIGAAPFLIAHTTTLALDPALIAFAGQNLEGLDIRSQPVVVVLDAASLAFAGQALEMSVAPVTPPSRFRAPLRLRDVYPRLPSYWRGVRRT